MAATACTYGCNCVYLLHHARFHCEKCTCLCIHLQHLQLSLYTPATAFNCNCLHMQLPSYAATVPVYTRNCLHMQLPSYAATVPVYTCNCLHMWLQLPLCFPSRIHIFGIPQRQVRQHLYMYGRKLPLHKSIREGIHRGSYGQIYKGNCLHIFGHNCLYVCILEKKLGSHCDTTGSKCDCLWVQLQVSAYMAATASIC